MSVVVMPVMEPPMGSLICSITIMSMQDRCYEVHVSHCHAWHCCLSGRPPLVPWHVIHAPELDCTPHFRLCLRNSAISKLPLSSKQTTPVPAAMSMTLSNNASQCHWHVLLLGQRSCPKRQISDLLGTWQRQHGWLLHQTSFILLPSQPPWSSRTRRVL
jgi:hypothetical protein